jgi:hypothetical protein
VYYFTNAIIQLTNKATRFLDCRRTISRNPREIKQAPDHSRAKIINHLSGSIRGHFRVNFKTTGMQRCEVLTLLKIRVYYFTNAIIQLTNKATGFLDCRHTISLKRGIKQIDQTRASTFKERLEYTRGQFGGKSLGQVTRGARPTSVQRCEVLTLMKIRMHYFTNAINQLTNKATRFLDCRRTISLKRGIK